MQLAKLVYSTISAFVCILVNTLAVLRQMFKTLGTVIIRPCLRRPFRPVLLLTSITLVIAALYMLTIETSTNRVESNQRSSPGVITNYEELMDIFWSTSSTFGPPKPQGKPDKKFTQDKETPRNLNETKASGSIKRILFWTTFFDWKDYQFGIGQKPFYRAGCRVTNCMTTNDRTFINQSDALIFHPNNFEMKDLPSHRMPHQRYVFAYYEALTSQRFLPVFNNISRGFFNWTMTYRRDSDIYSSQHYGTIIRRKKTLAAAAPSHLPMRLPPGISPPDPATIFFNSTKEISNKSLSYLLPKKKRLIAWFSSNCHTPSLREVYFRRLANSIPIDIYGECGNLDCLPWKSFECDKLLKDYKFYIAAENSICADYVTEKFYRALEAGVIPIVYGGADYSAYAPPHSFIHVADFDSPEDLADYLILLSHNQNLYSAYLEWKKEWRVIRNPMNGWCDLCEKLNDPGQPLKNYQDIDKWWFDKIPCISGESVLKKLLNS